MPRGGGQGTVWCPRLIGVGFTPVVDPPELVNPSRACPYEPTSLKEPAYEDAGSEHQAKWREWVAAVDTLDTSIKPHPTSLPDQVGSDEMTDFCGSR
jgi:hypothetical protein